MTAKKRNDGSGGTGTRPAARPGKYLTFTLGEECYGVDVRWVQEIIRMTDITRVPNTPEFVRGVINLRGRITPIVEMRGKFGLERQETTDRTCIVVVQPDGEEGDVTVGLIVDEVCEVLDIAEGEIDRAPRLGADEGPDFLLGVGKVADGIVILLDIERVLSRREVDIVEEVTTLVKATEE